MVWVSPYEREILVLELHYGYYVTDKEVPFKDPFQL